MSSLALNSRFIAYGALGIGVFLVLLLLSQGTVQAAPCPNNRYVCNNAEQNARDRCANDGTNVYGAIWFNNTGSAATDDGYYASRVVVNGTASTVTVNIRGSVWDCGVGAGGGVWATSISPQGGNAWRLTGLSSGTLFRGSYNGVNRWTSQGGSISATLNVSNLPSGNTAGTQTFNIDLHRCYSSNGSTATGSCYPETITITVVRQNVPATVRAMSSVNGVSHPTATSNIYINPAETATFRQWLTATGHGSQDHTVTSRLQRCYVTSCGTTGWNNVSTERTTDITSDGDFGVYANHSVGLSTDGVPAGTRRICERLNIADFGGASDDGNPSSASCARIRGGTTYATAAASPQFIEAGESSMLRGRIITTGFQSWGGAAEARYNVTCSWVITGLTAGTSLTSGGTSGDCSRTISEDGIIASVTRELNTTPAVQIGTRICLSIIISVPEGLGTSSTEEDCTTVVAKPYLKAFAGDISAGCTGAGATSPSATAGIRAWNQGAGSGFAGAGSAFAAFALGDITEFASAQGGNGTGIASSPRGLAFASTNPALPYGGQYGSRPCVPDYYSGMPGTMTDIGAATTFNITAQPSGAYYRDGNLRLPGGSAGQVLRGRLITLYVTGNVFIEGNIIAQDTGSANVDDIPVFRLIVCGNISIAAEVRRIDAMLVAQPACGGGMTGGQIYTCGNSDYTIRPVNEANFAACNSQLVINGSLSAHRIFFTRTYGTLSRHGNQFTWNSSGTNNAAEIIQYNPLNWLRLEADATAGGSTNTTIRYDSIISLPPVL